MSKPHSSALSESRPRYWLRVLRPLSWWLLLVLVLYGIRTHQRWMEQTRLVFTASVEGRADYSEPVATFDGQAAVSGQRISLGNHRLVVTHPKGETYATNLFTWYGGHNFGKIALPRVTGRLAVTANPPASRLTIRGPEFSVTLTNSPGFSASVPTDEYLVEAQSRHWQSRQSVSVSKNTPGSLAIAPKLGALQLSCNQSGATFRLLRADNEVVEAGDIPATMVELPAGAYQLVAWHRQQRWAAMAEVKSETNNHVQVEFHYGSAVLETKPPGASVTSSDGHDLGATPLSLAELPPGPWDFVVRLDEYEPVKGQIFITANQTNWFQTNLISQHFTRAMAAARRHYGNTDYERAAEAATEALKYKAGDDQAVALQKEAATMAHLVRAQTLAARGEFADAMSEVNLVLTTTPDHQQARALLADYTVREAERIEAVRKHEAEQAEIAFQRRERARAEQQAQQRLKLLRDEFAAANQSYESASRFAPQEMVTTNDVTTVANRLNYSLKYDQPAFSNVKMSWITPHLFRIEARQTVGIGYRACLILGAQLRDDGVRIEYKVFEYEHPPEASLLGGLLQVSVDYSATSPDPKVAAANAERFRQRTKEGVKIVTERIRGAAGLPPIEPANPVR